VQQVSGARGATKNTDVATLYENVLTIKSLLNEDLGEQFDQKVVIWAATFRS